MWTLFGDVNTQAVCFLFTVDLGNFGVDFVIYRIFVRDSLSTGVVIMLDGNDLWTLMKGTVSLEVDGVESSEERSVSLKIVGSLAPVYETVQVAFIISNVSKNWSRISKGWNLSLEC